jgi:BASS family bile acid:Na+ symporter
MSALISKYFSSIIVVLGIVLGFSLPQVGSIWRPYLALLLMLLMFLVTLGVELNEFAHAVGNYPATATALFTTFVLLPLLALSAKPLFSPTIYAGTMLALCCPSAVVSAFWTKTFKGDVAIALVIVIATSLLSIVTVPGTMLLAVGTALNVDILGMMMNLAEIILIPMVASFLIKRYVHVNWGKANRLASKAELLIIVFVVWGSVAPGVEYVRSNVAEFASLNVFMFGLLALAFILTHLLTRRFGYKTAISIGIATTVKNAALSLVVGLTAFGPQILPPLIANLITQNLLLIPAKTLARG